VFGHGWSSEWNETDERGVLAAAIELARLNRATHAGDRGSINRPKARSA
jgi:P2-related tail formation protein